MNVSKSKVIPETSILPDTITAEQTFAIEPIVIVVAEPTVKD